MILLIGALHGELECKEARVVRLLARRLELSGVVHARLEERWQPLKLLPATLRKLV